MPEMQWRMGNQLNSSWHSVKPPPTHTLRRAAVCSLLAMISSLVAGQDDGAGRGEDWHSRSQGDRLRLSPALGEASRVGRAGGTGSGFQPGTTGSPIDVSALDQGSEAVRSIPLPQGELNRGGIVGATRLRLENGTPVLERDSGRGGE